MSILLYIDAATGLPHIYNHDVSEDEVEQALANRGEDRRRVLLLCASRSRLVQKEIRDRSE